MIDHHQYQHFIWRDFGHYSLHRSELPLVPYRYKHFRLAMPASTSIEQLKATERRQPIFDDRTKSSAMTGK
jgi:hypothetical protein